MRIRTLSREREGGGVNLLVSGEEKVSTANQLIPKEGAGESMNPENGKTRWKGTNTDFPLRKKCGPWRKGQQTWGKEARPLLFSEGKGIGGRSKIGNERKKSNGFPKKLSSLNSNQIPS